MKLPDMTPGEMRGIQEILGWKAPVCPVCGKPMNFGIDRLSDGSYIVDYSSPCGWRITPQKGKRANLTTLDAYNLAVKRY